MKLKLSHNDMDRNMIKILGTFDAKTSNCRVSIS